MRKARPLLALTCLLDLLFVMVFVALLLEEPQKLQNLQGITKAQELEIHTLKSESSQMEAEVNKTNAELNQAQAELDKAQSDLAEAKQKLEQQQKSQQNTILAKGIWKQFIKVNGRWKEASTQLLYLDSEGKYKKAHLNMDTTWVRTGKLIGEITFNDQIWIWKAQFSSSESGTFDLKKSADGEYTGWLIDENGRKKEENRWVKIRNSL